MTRFTRVALVSGLALLVLLASVFPLRGIPRRVNDDASFQTAADAGWSLEGFRWLEEENTVSLWDVENLQVQQDAGIITWLRANVEGSPTIVEAWGPGYQWFNRLRNFYTVPDELLAEKFLLTYDVSYVIVGSAENALRKEGGNVVGPVMGDDVKAMFAAMPSLVEVYREGDAVIYEVDKEEVRRGKFTHEAIQIVQR